MANTCAQVYVPVRTIVYVVDVLLHLRYNLDGYLWLQAQHGSLCILDVQRILVSAQCAILVEEKETHLDCTPRYRASGTRYATS